jgi:hypothetical protein
MPRFDPPIEASYQSFVDSLIEVATGDGTPLKLHLSPSASLLFGLIKSRLQEGVSSAELRNIGSPPLANADQHAKDALDQWITDLDIGTARVLCVTPDPDNSELWDRYAVSHSGAVLGFRHLPALSTPLLAARQVSYSALEPIVGSGLDFLLYGDTPELRRQAFDAIFMTKRAFWSNQQEWRTLTWRPNEAGLFGDYSFYPDELASVTCGRNASDDFRVAMQDLVHAHFPNCRFALGSPSA